MTVLEKIVRSHSPRAVSYDSVPSAGSPAALTSTDVLAALGMIEKRAFLGHAAFCAKLDLSHSSVVQTIALLAAAGIKQALHYPALMKINGRERAAIITVISGYALLDYARSPDTVIPCPACGHHPNKKSLCCKRCSGKGVVRAACPDCKGRGQSVNRIKSELKGVPVYQPCHRCGGRGFTRLTSSTVYRAIAEVTSEISLDVWNKSIKHLLSFLIAELHREEAWAEKLFSLAIK